MLKFIQLLVYIQFRFANFFELEKYVGYLGALRFALTTAEVACRIPTWDGVCYLRGRSSDFATLRQVFRDKQYQHPELPAEPITILDLGANIGLASIYFRTRFRNARIISVEPDSENFKLLSRNCGTLAKFELLCAAVSSMCGTLTLQNPDASSDSFQFKSDPNGTVTAYTIRDIMAIYGVNRIDILKIDIEGAELDLFQNRNDWLHDVDFILMETHDHIVSNTTAEVTSIAKKFDFHVEPYGEGLAIFRKVN